MESRLRFNNFSLIKIIGSEKKIEIFERRTMVYAYVKAQGYLYYEVANILGIEKTMVSRDMQYLEIEKDQFISLLNKYVNEIELWMNSKEYTMKLNYDQQKVRRHWLMLAHQVLDVYNEE